MSLSVPYLFLKLQAMTLLVFNQKNTALTRFEQMLGLRPRDFYALASRAQVLAQLGRKADALAAQEQLVDAASRQSGRLLQPGLHA
jgi:predicted Zn-dependent protease